MFVLEKPYVSPFLAETVINQRIPVLKTGTALELLPPGANWVEEAAIVDRVKREGRPLFYSNSENSIGWFARAMDFTDLPDKIDLFKNKIRFREMLRPLYPDYFFRAVAPSDLKTIDVSTLPKPFVIKPAAGFMSLGVHRISDDSEWSGVVKSIEDDLEAMSKIYPPEVFDASDFIIEGNIEGEEFAVDVYYDQHGEPVILNILHHHFASDKDMSDRVYVTSASIVESHYDQVLGFMKELGRLAGLSSFPMHAEFRFEPGGRAVPIEINPLRFAGWCTTDVAYHAYGINVYEYVYKQLRPDWDRILTRAGSDMTLMSVAEVPAGIDVNAIQSVDYRGLISSYTHPLEVREVDYKTYRVLAFIFDRIPGDRCEAIQEVLHADLSRFISVKSLL